MIKNILLSAFLVLALSASAFAETQVITLKDGSQIKGELVGIANGVYTINTPMLGDVHIDKAQVTSISDGSAPVAQAAQTAPANVLQTPQAPQANADLTQKIQAAQVQLMSNPDFIADMQKMAQDPEITQLLSDPALVQAVTSKNVNAMKNNPHAQQLMSNPKMKALIEKMQGSSSPSSSQ